MQSMTIKEIAVACGGTIIGEPSLCDVNICGIRINSKQIKQSELFIAVKGEFKDGHDYIDSAFDNGAVCVVSEKNIEDKPHILVKSTFAALKDIAEYYRSLFDIKVIGITGSVGKTTAKEMVYNVLKQKYKVMKTKGNFNNEFGLPQTIFNIEKKHEIAVVEMGMSQFGEIKRLSKVAKPDVALIMNIGESHIGNLGSRDNIFKAKSEIFEYMKEDGIVVLNGDDDKLSTLVDMGAVFFGIDKSNDVSVKEIIKADMSGTRLIADCFGEDLELFIPKPGEYMIYPALAAVAVGVKLGLNLGQIAIGVKEYIPITQRMDIVKTDKLTIIDDVYNASRQSMLAGAQILKFAPSRSVAIVGDVLELGKFGQQIHFEIGEGLAKQGIDLIICIGDMAKHIWQGASNVSAGGVVYYETQEYFFEKIHDLIEDGDTIFVKASRGMHFEKIVDRLKDI